MESVVKGLSVTMCDADRIVATTPELERLSGATLLLTGGTGFIGSWVLEVLAALNRRNSRPCRVLAMSRNPGRLIARSRSRSWLRATAADVRTASWPACHFDYIVHAGTPGQPRLTRQEPAEVADIAAIGSERLLQYATARPPKALLVLSSGAVYGSRALGAAPVHEEEYEPGEADCCSIVDYAHVKRRVERLATATWRHYGVPVKIARLFTFVGPHLAPDAGFAVTDFLGDAISGRSIGVAGDGRSVRSYMYAGDLVRAILRLLLDGAPGRPYNVGSSTPVSILDLARAVSRCSGELPITVGGHSSAVPTSYVPDTSRLRDEVGVTAEVSLEDALKKTLRWLTDGRRTAPFGGRREA